MVFFKLCPDAQCIVYLPTCTIKNQLFMYGTVGKYTIPMEPMGMGNLWVLNSFDFWGCFMFLKEKRHGNPEGFSKEIISSQAMSKLDEVLQARKKDVLNFANWFFVKDPNVSPNLRWYRICCYYRWCCRCFLKQSLGIHRHILR